MSGILLFNLAIVAIGIVIGLVDLDARVRSSAPRAPRSGWTETWWGYAFIAGILGACTLAYVALLRDAGPSQEWGFLGAVAAVYFAKRIGPGRDEGKAFPKGPFLLIFDLAFAQYVLCSAASDVLGVRESSSYLAVLRVSRVLFALSVLAASIGYAYSAYRTLQSKPSVPA